MIGFTSRQIGSALGCTQFSAAVFCVSMILCIGYVTFEQIV